METVSLGLFTVLTLAILGWFVFMKLMGSNTGKVAGDFAQTTLKQSSEIVTDALKYGGQSLKISRAISKSAGTIAYVEADQELLELLDGKRTKADVWSEMGI